MSIEASQATDLGARSLFNVTDAVAIVTGGAGGLGYAYAQVLAANGARVVLIDQDEAGLSRAVAQLTAAGGQVSAELADVADRHLLKRVIDGVAARFGRLDVVFANAGIAEGPGFLDLQGRRDPAGAIENIPDALWDRIISVNLTSVLSTIQAAAPHMKRQGAGRIIATASAAALNPGAIVGTPYFASKAGVLHLVKQAALELARYGITVNAICPGPFLTALVPPDLEAAFRRGSLAGRVADVREIQGLALFLASPAASYITGTHVLIDGGKSLGRAD